MSTPIYYTDTSSPGIADFTADLEVRNDQSAIRLIVTTAFDVSRTPSIHAGLDGDRLDVSVHM